MIMPLDRSRTESEKERKGRNRRTDGRTDGRTEGGGGAAAKRKNEMKGRMTSGEDATATADLDTRFITVTMFNVSSERVA